MLHIHYDPTDGKIVGWETGTENALAMDGLRVLYSQLDTPPDPKKHKVDLATLNVVEMSAAEKAEASAPTDVELRQAVFRALQASDHMMLLDRDDIPQQKLASWKQYRKALRDLSKGSPAPTTAQMVAAWPADPDGNDAIAHLRKQK